MRDSDDQQVWKRMLTIKYSQLAVSGEPEESGDGKLKLTWLKRLYDANTKSVIEARKNVDEEYRLDNRMFGVWIKSSEWKKMHRAVEGCN